MSSIEVKNLDGYSCPGCGTELAGAVGASLEDTAERYGACFDCNTALRFSYSEGRLELSVLTEEAITALPADTRHRFRQFQLGLYNKMTQLQDFKEAREKEASAPVMPKQYQLPPMACPSCAAVLTAATPVRGKAQLKPGDYSLCLTCAAPLQFVLDSTGAPKYKALSEEAFEAVARKVPEYRITRNLLALRANLKARN